MTSQTPTPLTASRPAVHVRAASDPAQRPFDDVAARAGYLHWLAHHAERESPHFATKWAEARQGVERDCYLGFLTLPGLELARRQQPSPPLDHTLVAHVLRSCARPTHKNWTLPILIWWQARYAEAFTADEREAIKRACIDTKFWMHDPGQDHDCYFTENHQIIFHVIEYLIGGLWPDEIFPITGRSGTWHRQRARTSILRWLGWRARFGFSEFKSYGYSDAILFILTTLREFCGEETIRTQADAIIDQVLMGYALNTFDGNLAACQGRSDLGPIVQGAVWMPSAVGSLLWGIGRHDQVISAGAIVLSCSGYDVPAAIQAIARDRGAVVETRERESLDPDEALAYGVDPASDEDAMFFWGSQQFCHPLTIATSRRIMPWDGYYMNPRVAAWSEQHRLQAEANLPPAVDTDHTAIGRAEQYACRTREWKLSCLQDFRAGQRGFQQLVWQATLGGQAIIFSQQPGNGLLHDSGGYWKGNGVLPRAAGWRSLCIAIHRVRPDQTLWHQSHLFFPRWTFDEVIEDAGWIFGRRGRGFAAVRSLLPAGWSAPDPGVIRMMHPYDPVMQERALASHYEWSCGSHANAFICELGSVVEHGSFAAFVHQRARARVEGDWRRLAYQSPTHGRVEFGWTGGFTIAGREIPLRQDWRLDCPYGRVRFGDSRFTLTAAGHRLDCDALRGIRRMDTAAESAP